MFDWGEIDKRLKVASPFLLTPDERERVGRVEQQAYEANLPILRAFLEAHEKELKQRGFWTELKPETTGLRFRYSLHGFYGPGGFSSQSHVAGLLVLGRIDPKGDQYASFYANDLGKNLFIGERFDEIALSTFVRDDLLSYMAPENQILSADHYRWVKDLLDASNTE